MMACFTSSSCATSLAFFARAMLLVAVEQHLGSAAKLMSASRPPRVRHRRWVVSCAA
jgi:hypothetical protein